MNKPVSKKLRDALKNGKIKLTAVSDSSSLDAQVLLAHILGKNRAYLLAHPEEILTQDQIEEYENLLNRMVDGEALPYILGEWEFFGLPFFVTPDVLIPRPETEILVETAVDWLKGQDDGLRMVDVGTGSGIIPVCIASQIAALEISAMDISSAALDIASKNAAHHNLSGRIEFIKNDLLENIEKDYDLITANLPYIPTETLRDLAVLKSEPRLALDGGDDGLSLIRRLLNQAPVRLNSGGLILLEIEYRQGEEVKEIALEAFPTAQINVKKDLAGQDRLVIIQA